MYSLGLGRVCNLLLGRAGGAGGASSSPPDGVAGLAAWYDASDSDTITEASNLVSAWADKSSNGNDATNATGTQQPTLVSSGQNGLDILRFDGTNDFLLIPENTVGNSVDGMTIIIAAKQDVTEIGPVIYYETSSTGARIELGYAASNQYRARVRRSPAVGQSTHTGGTSTTTWRITTLSVDWVNGNLSIYANGTLTFGPDSIFGATGQSEALNSDQGVIGGNPSNEFFDGDIGEIAVYEAVLADADRISVENYMTTRWGVT